MKHLPTITNRLYKSKKAIENYDDLVRQPLSFSPSIFGPTRNSNVSGRRGSRGLGGRALDNLRFYGGFLLGCILKIIFSIVMGIGLIILVEWLIVRTHELKFNVTHATLTKFNLSVDNTNHLDFDLVVDLIAQNPNRHIGVYYEDIQADVIYGGQRLKTIEGMTFYQRHINNESVGPLVFKGQNMMVFGSEGESEFEKQSQDWVYEIQMNLRLWVTFEVGFFKTRTWNPKVKCHLNVPLDGKSSLKFQETKCHYYF